jgi:hypothetical protein
MISLEYLRSRDEWKPNRSAIDILNDAERRPVAQQIVLVLPFPQRGCRTDHFIDATLAQFVRVVLALYPTWPPDARFIDGPAGAGAADIEDVARATGVALTAAGA